MKSIVSSATLAGVVWLVSCGGGSTPEARKQMPAAPPVDLANAGSISGKAVFRGARPERKTLSMDATPACARQHSGPIYAEDAVIGAGGELKNAFIYIKAGLPPRDYPLPQIPVKLDQKGCIYTPRVVGIMVNQTLEIYNSDDTNHNVHPMPKLNREWNESQPPKGEVKVKTFPREEVPPILFKCNVHPWMRAWVGVVSHPYFAVSAEDGSFTIKDVPPGEYTLEAWHERFGALQIPVKVEPKGAATAEFPFKQLE